MFQISDKLIIKIKCKINNLKLKPYATSVGSFCTGCSGMCENSCRGECADSCRGNCDSESADKYGW